MIEPIKSWKLSGDKYLYKDGELICKRFIIDGIVYFNDILYDSYYKQQMANCLREIEIYGDCGLKKFTEYVDSLAKTLIVEKAFKKARNYYRYMSFSNIDDYEKYIINGEVDEDGVYFNDYEEALHHSLINGNKLIDLQSYSIEVAFNEIESFR